MIAIVRCRHNQPPGVSERNATRRPYEQGEARFFVLKKTCLSPFRATPRSISRSAVTPSSHDDRADHAQFLMGATEVVVMARPREGRAVSRAGGELTRVEKSVPRRDRVTLLAVVEPADGGPRCDGDRLRLESSSVVGHNGHG